MIGPSGEPLHWGRLYAAATLAGAGLGLLVALEALPYIPPQLTAWMRRVSDPVAAAVVVLGGALVGLVLAAVAHLGVHWQLRQRRMSDANDS
jgi:hypothetical protein